MSTFTREQLRARAREKVKSLEFSITQTAFADSRAELEEELELARIALASLEAEPVAYMYKDNLHSDARFSLHTRFGNWSQEDINEYEITEIPLYAGPTAPVSVPDENDAILRPVADLYGISVPGGRATTYSIDSSEASDCRVMGWSVQEYVKLERYQAAMLQGAESAESRCSNYPVIPDGWVACSERMPDENAEKEVLACFKGGDISTLYYFEGRWDDAYGIVPIRQDVTHWMPLPAAPQQEVKP
ncbi:DUF551 domain-containing protein [Enterobacter roggenkampii]|uniref:DUF551 domain-containing protein n=1 Tax=Enterobacter roggenkampii TaxID=1812935 RepID=UPI0013F43FF6|nr:DUF551 domain-containing protein [Enterobacter roggenkampii]NHA25123.1 DUF551 domain-containing protein [Enterobacter roggenkampii]